MNKNLLVSVIIPAHQASSVLYKAVQSVLTQDFPDFELIIIDDASTDRTWEVIKELEQTDARIHGIQLESNQGPAGARNAGIVASSGELIAFLDADDEWLPNKLKYQVDLLVNHSNVDLVFTDSFTVNKSLAPNTRQDNNDLLFSKNNKFIGDLILNPILGSDAAFVLDGPVQRSLYSKCFILPSTVVMRRSSFNKIGGFNPNRFGTEDIDLWVRLALFGKFVCWNKPTVNRYVIDSSISAMSEKWLLELIDYHSMCLASEEYSQLRDLSIINLEKFFRYIVIYHAKRNQRGKALALFKRSLMIGFKPRIALYSIISCFGSFPFIVAEKLLSNKRPPLY